MSGPMAFGGVVTFLRPIIERGYKLLKEYSVRKDTRERLRESLQAMSKLGAAMNEVEEAGLRLKKAVEEAQVPIGYVTSERIYKDVAIVYEAIAKSISALRDLALEAKTIMQFESFMERISRVDGAFTM